MMYGEKDFRHIKLSLGGEQYQEICPCPATGVTRMQERTLDGHCPGFGDLTQRETGDATYLLWQL